MRSVVTGGAGFIGSHVVDALRRREHDILILDDLSAGHRENLEAALAEGVRLSVGDITDAGFVGREVDGFAPEAIFHLAAQADVRRGVADPAFDARVNVIGTIHLLEAARRAGASQFVFAATGGAVYGEGERAELPFTEETPPAPFTPYGASKLAGETYVELYRRLHGLPGVALRFGNVYGPRQDPHGEAGVVAIFCGRLLAGERPTIFGDGAQTRDYVYVGDTVAAAVAASDALARDPDALAGPYNIGTGAETSVVELLDRLAAIAGIPPEAEHAPARTGEVQRVVIDPAAAARDLGWRARVGLDEGLAATLEEVRGRRADAGI